MSAPRAGNRIQKKNQQRQGAGLVSQLAAHFHDTYGQALANIHAVMQCGITLTVRWPAGRCPMRRELPVTSRPRREFTRARDGQQRAHKLLAAGRFISDFLGVNRSRVRLQRCCVNRPGKKCSGAQTRLREKRNITVKSTVKASCAAMAGGTSMCTWSILAPRCAYDALHRGGVIKAGEAVSHMWLRFTIDLDFLIHEVHAASDQTPFSICPRAQRQCAAWLVCVSALAG